MRINSQIILNKPYLKNTGEAIDYIIMRDYYLDGISLNLF